MISIITINYNDSKFKVPMIYALNKLTKNKFNFIIVDNGSDKENLKILSNLNDKYKFLNVIYRKQSIRGSYAHGEALNFAINRVKDKYTCVFDGDAIPLLKNWDELLIKNINDNIKIIGATTPKHEKVKRLGSGEFPMPFFSLFDTNIFKTLNIDNRPNNISEGEDTCWEWVSKFKYSNYKSDIFMTVNTRSNIINNLFSDCYAIEVYYYKNKLIGSHYGRGSTFGLPKYFSIMKKKNGCYKNAFKD